MRCFLERALKSWKETVTQPVLLISDAKHCALRALISHSVLTSLGATGLLCPESPVCLGQHCPKDWIKSKLWEIWGDTLDLLHNFTKSESQTPELIFQRFLCAKGRKGIRAWLAPLSTAFGVHLGASWCPGSDAV